MKKRKLNKIVLILLVIALFVLIIADIFLMKNKKSVGTEKEILVPTGTYKLIKSYNGENKYTDLYKGMYKFANYIKKLQKKVANNDGDIIKYFENKKIEITENTGIENVEEFKKLVTYLKSAEKIDSLKSAKIDTDTIEEKERELVFDTIFIYENGVELKFKTYFKENITYANEIFRFEVIDQ